jgi:2-polyprenyl-6-methoxyphenol hydroxylase-like FAD-dependent oxidoreductase
MPGKFKVIIVGGSVTGLTLANLFQKLGIDYVVLEAYGSIAPQVGASIGLHPNGLRILDQLDCYEDIRKLAAPAWNFFTRDGDGRQLYSHDVTGQVEARHVLSLSALQGSSAR